MNISEAFHSSPLGQNPSTADLGRHVGKVRVMANRSEAPKRSSEAQAIDGLPVIRYNVAGIDLGSKEHWVCALSKGDRGREIAEFRATTPELLRMAQGLKERQVESVAMESTGVYWIPLSLLVDPTSV